jgi:hypothetical protein
MQLTVRASRRTVAEQMLHQRRLYGRVSSGDAFRKWLTVMLTGKAPDGKPLQYVKSDRYGIRFDRVGAQQLVL